MYPIFWISIIALAAIFTSCEKVIEVDLNNSAPQVVIEAALIPGTNLFTVQVTQTGDYFTATDPTPINNATVVLQEENGVSTIIPFEAQGHYSKTITAQEGKSYTLTVTIGDKIYEAKSYLPPVVSLDTLTLEEAPFQGLGSKDTTYNVYINFTDPAIVANNYRLLITVNDTLVPMSDVILNL